MEPMVNRSLDALLLYALTIPIVMKYRILPVEGTPYWLFGILFTLLTLNVVIAIYPDILGVWKKRAETVKHILFFGVVMIVLGGVTVTAMVDRARVAPVYGVHDIILQQEAAMRYLIVGKNPYKETYFGTPVESFNYDEPGNTEATNPALYHFVMPPWYVLFPFSLYYSVRPVVGFFDGRFASLFAMVGLLYVLWIWFRPASLARVAMTLTAFSPAVFDYFLEGRSDVFALFWLVWALYLLDRKQMIWSAVMLALAFLSKQTTWFVLPFYIGYLWSTRQKPYQTLGKLACIILVIGGIFCIPFLLWDGNAFINSVVFYLSGNAPHSYPVSGYGLGMILREFGVIGDIHAYYPFVLWQAALGLPVLAVLLFWIKKTPTISKVLIAYGVFLTVIWYTSRYFNNSHVGYISMLFVLGLLKDTQEAQVLT